LDFSSALTIFAIFAKQLLELERSGGFADVIFLM